MKIIERLQDYIEHKGISYNAFDKSIEASNGYIGKQIKNKSSIGGDVIEKIISIYTDLNIAWLITGTGSMIKGYQDEENTVNDKKSTYKKQSDCQQCEIKDRFINELLKQIDVKDKQINKLLEKIENHCEEETMHDKKRNAS